MPIKKELQQRIAALEAQVAMLSAQVAAQRPTVVPVPQPYYPSPTYPQITCTSASTIPADAMTREMTRARIAMRDQS